MDLDQSLGTNLFHEVIHGKGVAPWLRKMELHDEEVLRHSLLAGAIASEFCHFVRLTLAEERLLVTGALLHDVGKVAVASQTLQKTSPLTQVERRELKRHPTVGVSLLQTENWEPEILEMVHFHHERLDGSGYPHGLAGDKISRLVRMLMICDVFSALIEGRSYRPSPRKPVEIMGVMANEFDESLLHIFSREVPDLAYRAQRILNPKVPVTIFAA